MNSNKTHWWAFSLMIVYGGALGIAGVTMGHPALIAMGTLIILGSGLLWLAREISQ